MQAMYSRLEHDDCNMNAWSATVSLELIMTPRTHIRLGTRSSNTSIIPKIHRHRHRLHGGPKK